MSGLKERLYEKIVRKNERVRRAYERYVIGHLAEHRSHRLKHWLVLLLLAWKYRPSQKGRLHRIQLLGIKDGRGTIRMEKIFGAVCYNLYRSEDGVHYRFLAKTKKSRYKTGPLPPDTMFFYKFKVSMDGSFYSDFSEVLSVSTVADENLYWARKLAALKGGDIGAGKPEGQGKSGKGPKGRQTHGLRAEADPGGGASLSWDAAAGALHYNVYRAGEDGEFRFLAQTRQTRLLDDRIPPGLYSYRIKYTCDNRKYHDLGEAGPVKTQIPQPGAGGRLYEKGPESEASNRVSPMNFAKGLMPYPVISFDIFDTLIFRPFSVPSDLFVLVGERLDIMDFCEIRKNAEQQARNDAYLKRGNKEVTLLQIYGYVARETGIDAEEGARTEFETELSLCRPNPYMQTVYRLLAGQNKTLAAVSDMYLPEAWMRKLLVSCGYDQWDQVIVSCDYNCSKRNGGLFDILTDRYEGQEIVHVGDNPHSDYESARKKGLAARLYQNVNEAGNGYRALGMSHLAGSAYRGVVNARLHSGMERFNPYYEVGYVYTGIYVMGFCQWIYRYAREHHLDKILFLAREGDLYRKVFTQMYPDFPTEYVLWSRVPVVKTTVEKNRHPYLLQLVHHKANALYKSRVGTLFDRVGIGELKKYFPKYRLHDREYLTPANEKVVYSLLVDHWQELCGCYRADQEAVRDYLTRMLAGSRRAAVVDVGWSGNNVLQVRYLVEEVYHLDCRISCLLAAARNVNDTYMAAMMQKRQVETYLFSSLDNKGLHDLHQAGNHHLNSFFFEILTQSCTPTFLGFDREGRILYDIPEAENYAHNREIHRGCLDFVRDYTGWFRDFPYMLDISGHDAYMPFLHFAGHLSWLRKYFGGYIFGRDLFATQDGAVMESVRQVMEKAKLWEEEKH